MFDLSNIEGFDWDRGNKRKNWNKHQVGYIECEEVFFNRPLITGKDKKHSTDETRYFALGRTDAGRPLFLAFTIRNNKIGIISAREQTDKEWQRYGRQI